MELKKIEGKNLIYDGTEDGFYKEHSFKLNNGDEIKFSPMDVIELEDFEKEDSENLISKLLEKLPTIKRFSPASDFIYYKNLEEITPHIKENDKYISIISLGEVQPTRYQIYIEAIFSK